MKKLMMIVVFICILSFMPGTASAALPSGYYEGWEVIADSRGWGPNTIVSTVTTTMLGGNPNGYLISYGNGLGSMDIGALSELQAITGDFGGNLWTVSVDLQFIWGNFDNIWLRFRYLDSTQNGWVHSLTNDFSLGNWQSTSVTFDPSWTDAEAMANGWLTDQAVSTGANPSVAWSLNMSDVYTTEIRFSGTGILAGGIDNFRLQAASVPEPGTMLLLGAGLAGLGIMRKRFKA